MSIKPGMLCAVREFFGDMEIDEDWLIDHISVEFNDANRSVIFTIDNMNCQEYQWLKDQA